MLLVEDRLKAARDHAQAGRHENAAILYEGILDIAPGHPEALAHLLEYRLQEGDLDSARERMSQATPKTMENAHFLTLCAKVMILSDKPDEAERFADRAVALDETQPDAVMMKAEFLAAAGQISEAEVLLTRLRGIVPDNTDILLAIARLYAGFGLFGPALEVAQDAVHIAPDQADLNALVADMLSQLGDHAKASPFYEKAHLSEPNNAAYLLGLAANCEAVGQKSEALRLVKRTTLLFPEFIDGWLFYIKIMAARNDAAAALREFAPVAKRIQDKTQATLALATAYRLAGVPAQALKLLAPLQKAAAQLSPPIRSQVMALSRNCFLSLGDPDAVALTLDEAMVGHALHLSAEAVKDPQALKKELQETAFVVDPAVSNLELMTLLRFVCAFSPDRSIEVVGPSAIGQLAALFGFKNYIANDVPGPETAPAPPKSSFPVSQLVALPPEVRGAVEAGLPYLQADPERVEKWRTALSDYPKPWIGLAWDGDPAKLTLETLLPAAGDLDGTLVATNWDETRHQLNGVGGILDAGRHFKSLQDLTALLACLDLVIGPDSLALHAAGALGKPGIVIHEFDGQWYWASTDRRSLWYPSIMTASAPRPGAWALMIAELTPHIHATAESILGPGQAALSE